MKASFSVTFQLPIERIEQLILIFSDWILVKVFMADVKKKNNVFTSTLLVWVVVVAIPFYGNGQPQTVPLDESDAIVFKTISASQQQTNPAEAILPLKKVARERIALSDSAQALLFLELGINYGRLFSDDSARLCLLKSNALAKKNKWTILQASTYNYFGNLFRNGSMNAKALACYDSGLRVIAHLSTKDRYIIESKILGNIGGIHYDLADYKKALEYAEKAKSVVLKHNLTDRLTYSYITVAFAARALGMNAVALENNQLALEGMLAEKDSSFLHHTYYNIGSLYQLERNYVKALESFDKALFIAERFKEDEVAVSCLIAKSQILTQQKKYAPALLSAEEASVRSKAHPFLPKIVESLQLMHQLYKVQNNWKEAALALEQQLFFKDSLFNIQSKEKMATIETRYETEKKEQQIKDLEQSNTIKDLEATTARQWQIGLILFLILLSVVIGVLYNRYQLKQKTAKALDEKNSELQKLNGFKDRMFAVISHDLRNPVDAFSTIIESLNQNLQHASKEELKEFFESTLDSAKDLKNLLNNLLEWSLVQIGKLPFNPQSASLKAIVSESVSHLESMASLKKIRIVNSVNGEHVLADREMITIIVRNLVSNAIKFSTAGKVVELKSQTKGGSIILSVIDEGVGMKPEELNKLFKPEENVRTIGSSAAKGAGIGLLLCKELTDKHDGKIYAKSEPDKGSTFYLELPTA